MQRPIALAVALFAAFGAAHAQSPNASPVAQRAVAAAHCADCGTVQAVHESVRQGESNALGWISGGAVGALLGHQVGGGTGKTLATVGGAAAGAYAGSEVQKRINSRSKWATKVMMKDGTAHTFEQDTKPVWKAGDLVHVRNGELSPL